MNISKYKRLEVVGDNGLRWLAGESRVVAVSRTSSLKSFFVCQCGNIFLSQPEAVKLNRVKSCGDCANIKRTKYRNDWPQTPEINLVIKPKTPIANRVRNTTPKPRQPPITPTIGLPF